MKDYYAGLGPAGVELLGLGAQDMPVGTDEVREAMDAYRAEVLREAADAIDTDDECACGHDPQCYACASRGDARMLRRMADAP